MTEITDNIVIGAGVIGLAIGRALAMDGRQVIVLDRNARSGEETSSRSSEVIHAGIYYAPGSLKARLCVHGKELLYEYCARKGVPHARCGKVIVAVHSKQQPRLEELEHRARVNGVDDLIWLNRDDLDRREPQVRATTGLWSPSTGIIDSHALMLALQGDMENAGGAIAVLSEFREAFHEPDGIRVIVASGDDISEVKARNVINASGLDASRAAGRFYGLAQPAIPDTRYAKGSYFLYNGASPFQHLVYPLPVDGGLGIHATLDLAGRLRFGPDVEWVDEIDYAIDVERADAFYEAIRDYWPSLPDDSLSPGYVGVRPKLCSEGEPPADFEIIGPLESDAGRVVHLLGIESPGLTASLAIADYVRQLLD